MKRLLVGLIFGSMLLLNNLPVAQAEVQSVTGGRVTSVYHYEGGQMTAIENKETSGGATWSYFQNGQLMSTQMLGVDIYKANYQDGKLVSSEDQNGTVTYYDDLGRRSRQVSKVYDETTKKTTESVVTFEYDDANRLAKMVSDNGKSYTVFTYDGSFLMKATTHKLVKNTTKGADGKDVTTETDVVTQVTNYKNGKEDVVNKYSDAGVLSSVTNVNWIATTGKRTDTVTAYDAAGNATTDVSTVVYDQFNRFDYSADANGNITQKAVYGDASRGLNAAQLASVVTILNPGVKDMNDLTKSYTGGTSITIYSQYGSVMHTEYKDYIGGVDVTNLDAGDLSSSVQYDPWTMGTIVAQKTERKDANGNVMKDEDGNTLYDVKLFFAVDPKNVQGTQFYNMDPTTVTGETKKDETGRYLFALQVEDEGTKNELAAASGKQVNIMWQYYTKTSQSGGNIATLWLKPTSDGAVNYHLSNDDANAVQQWGGTWDRSKQYVIL